MVQQTSSFGGRGEVVPLMFLQFADIVRILTFNERIGQPFPSGHICTVAEGHAVRASNAVCRERADDVCCHGRGDSAVGDTR